MIKRGLVFTFRKMPRSSLVVNFFGRPFCLIEATRFWTVVQWHQQYQTSYLIIYQFFYISRLLSIVLGQVSFVAKISFTFTVHLCLKRSKRQFIWNFLANDIYNCYKYVGNYLLMHFVYCQFDLIMLHKMLSCWSTLYFVRINSIKMRNMLANSLFK